jgi:hypothetical protein
MTSSSQRRRIAVFLVSAFLLFAWPTLAEPPGRADLGGFLARLWDSFTAIWSEEGCTIDPYGCPNGTGAPAFPDAGCSTDPDGRCLPDASELLPPPSPDEGCSADPYGGCRSDG